MECDFDVGEQKRHWSGQEEAQNNYLSEWQEAGIHQNNPKRKGAGKIEN